MEQIKRVGFQLPPHPWPEIQARVDGTLNQFRLAALGGDDLTRSRSKAGAGAEPRQERQRTPYVADTDRDAIRRSTASVSLLAQYYNLAETTIRNIKAEAAQIA